jgi:hypothetical protein
MSKPGTLTANVLQQDYFAVVTTRVVLPMFKDRNEPFVRDEGQQRLVSFREVRQRYALV